ncbi:MAG: inorganic phosphate transporter [Acidobacteriota bacterium]|nr:inorganic phosphate transporter [Acidobacteriota bacterium]MDH3528417.1 inorganic phosphate transporter [Acidobacteriota bacterium]
METFYLVIVIVLFFLAISDLIVGVSNDAVNFLNSAVGSKAASFRIIMAVAAVGILIGCTFSSGMMEVARKGIFHPEHFYFSEIMLLFLAVMITDVVLLDAFNSFGMPTSTTVSIVFELLGAASAFALIKVYTEINPLELSEYINTGKALAIISGILLSIVVAFTAGVIFQYLTRLLFSFDYKKSFKFFGGIWSGFAITAITYFILVKGVNGASFMTAEMKEGIQDNAFLIISVSFVAWSVILQAAAWLTNLDILKFVVLVGTFSLAMAFAGNDLVNFIGVPLAGFNSYELFSAGQALPEQFQMGGLAGKVPTPTILLLLAGAVMAITLWTSSKAKTVVRTSLDLGRQYDGHERFTSHAASRSLVRTFSTFALAVNNLLPRNLKNWVLLRFDQRPFVAKQAHLGSDAPSFDMIRAATTLAVASILISIGTAWKLPLSTTYVTFMVFMGTSLADGAWGRESAVYRVSGVLSVVGGWFFTAFSAFSIAFVIATILHFGGIPAIAIVLAAAGVVIYRTHRFHGKRLEEQVEFEKSIAEGTLSRADVLGVTARGLDNILEGLMEIVDETLAALEKEDLAKLGRIYKEFIYQHKRTKRVKDLMNDTLEKIEDDDAAHFYILTADYLNEMAHHVERIIKPSLEHVDNNHKPLLPVQIEELSSVNEELKKRIRGTVRLFGTFGEEEPDETLKYLKPFSKQLMEARKLQIKRIKNREIGTRNSQFYLSLLGELRNLALFTMRLVKVYEDVIAVPVTDAGEDVQTDQIVADEAVVPLLEKIPVDDTEGGDTNDPEDPESGSEDRTA